MLLILNSKLKNFNSISYGRGESLIAGDDDFKTFYEDYQDELDEIGKCPDVLIFDDSAISKELDKNIKSQKPRKELIELVKKAKAGLEIRSSAFLVSKYIEFMKSKKEDFKGRDFLSFTPKIEDLAVILKWIKIHRVPHFYVQVLFDRIYVISFERILEILSDRVNLNNKYFIEKNAKNQFKSTIHINLNEGICIAKDAELPEHKSGLVIVQSQENLVYSKHLKNSNSCYLRKEDERTTACCDSWRNWRFNTRSSRSSKSPFPKKKNSLGILCYHSAYSINNRHICRHNFQL
jgi:hypothetical protein